MKYEHLPHLYLNKLYFYLFFNKLHLCFFLHTICCKMEVTSLGKCIKKKQHM
jgi:hypothetical protein